MRTPDKRSKPRDADRRAHPLAAAKAAAKDKEKAKAKTAAAKVVRLSTPVVGDPAPVGDGAAATAPVIPLDGEGRPYITLAQLLKNQTLAPTGGAAKHLVRGGGITVNGQPEDRPGRKLHAGDVVKVGTATITVALG